MKRDDLERYLERGNQLGFVKRTDSNDFLGWILLEKQKPNVRHEALLAPGEDLPFVAQQEASRQTPYRIRILELNRDVHESNEYETDEDYRLNEKHNFPTLDEVELFLQAQGHSLENIKWRSELKAP